MVLVPPVKRYLKWPLLCREWGMLEGQHLVIWGLISSYQLPFLGFVKGRWVICIIITYCLKCKYIYLNIYFRVSSVIWSVCEAICVEVIVWEDWLGRCPHPETLPSSHHGTFMGRTHHGQLCKWWISWNLMWHYLLGGLEHFLCFHILGIIIPTDFHSFQRGWNHQPVVFVYVFIWDILMGSKEMIRASGHHRLLDVQEVPIAMVFVQWPPG